jgi:hypothetical protein
MNDDASKRLHELVGPEFSVGATGYTVNGEPTTEPSKAYYRWAVGYLGPPGSTEEVNGRVDPPERDSPEATERLRALDLGDDFVSMMRLQRSTACRVLLVHERAKWPQRFETTPGPWPEDGLVAVSDEGERFVCWHSVFSEEYRWHPVGLRHRPAREDEGATWDALLRFHGPLTVVGYETAPASFDE